MRVLISVCVCAAATTAEAARVGEEKIEEVRTEEKKEEKKEEDVAEGKCWGRVRLCVLCVCCVCAVCVCADNCLCLCCSDHCWGSQ